MKKLSDIIVICIGYLIITFSYFVLASLGIDLAVEYADTISYTDLQVICVLIASVVFYLIAFFYLQIYMTENILKYIEKISKKKGETR